MYNVTGMWRNSLPGGFSLIELMVSVGLMAVLTAGLVSVIGQGSRQTARDGRRQADLGSLRASLELFRNDNGTYPPCPGNAANCTTGYLPAAYMATLPTDPIPTRSYIYRPLDASGVGTCNGIVSGAGADRCVSFFLCAAGERTTAAAAGCPATCGGAFVCSLVVSSL